MEKNKVDEAKFTRIKQQLELNEQFKNKNNLTNSSDELFNFQTDTYTRLANLIGRNNAEICLYRMTYNLLTYIETGETKWTDKNVDEILKPELSQTEIIKKIKEKMDLIRKIQHCELAKTVEPSKMNNWFEATLSVGEWDYVFAGLTLAERIIKEFKEK